MKFMAPKRQSKVDTDPFVDIDPYLESRAILGSSIFEPRSSLDSPTIKGSIITTFLIN